MIPALRISVTNKEKILKNIEQIIDSKIKWTNSEFSAKSEVMFASLSQATYNIAVSSGSVAITALLYALEIIDGIIFAPVLTAPATILSCMDTNSKLVLVDADKDSFGMSASMLEEQIKKYYVNSNIKKGAVIMVHVGGIMSKNILEVKKVAEKYGLYFIEDCAHAHGSALSGKSAGSIGIAGTYSFFLTKTITCGEGGMITTNSKEISEKLRIIRNYGKSDKGLIVSKGSSWRLNEFTAAVLNSQIENYILYGAKRRQWIAQQYNQKIENDTFKIFKLEAESTSGYYKYILKINKPTDFDYAQFTKYMLENGIVLPAKIFDRITVDEPYINSGKQIQNSQDEFAIARYLCGAHVCLPIYEDLTDEEVKMIIHAVNNYHIAGVL